MVSEGKKLDFWIVHERSPEGDKRDHASSVSVIAPHSAPSVSFGSFGFFSKTWMFGSSSTKPFSLVWPIFPAIAL
ncbi:hypothetical protein H6F61_22075 [Cyanobacteria bacterium FACHB-472]|nr:hypothetical protein [Cyanobacteria bacterium FACHB-472]